MFLTTFTSKVLLFAGLAGVARGALVYRQQEQNVTLFATAEGLQFQGTWGPFNTFLFLENCPNAPFVTTSDPNPSVSYSFTGTGVYAILVSNAAGLTDCSGDITVDGTAHPFTIPARAGQLGDGLACTVVGIPDLTDAAHTGVVTMNGQQDRTRCPFIFAGLTITTDEPGSLTGTNPPPDATGSSSLTQSSPPSSTTASGSGSANTPRTPTTTQTGTSGTPTPTETPDAAQILSPGSLLALAAGFLAFIGL